MEPSLSFGLSAVLMGGIFQGSVLLPMKFTRRWQWENSWACFSTIAYLISPWFVALLLVPQFPSMLGDIPRSVLVTTMLFGGAWGLGALTMGLGFRYVGMAISYAIVLGITSSVGTLVPLLVLTPERAFTRQGVSVMLGVVIALAGTVVVSWAAWERDAKKQNPKALASNAGSGSSAAIGLVLCAGSGLLSSGGNLGFAFGNQISRTAHELGAGPMGAASAIWSVILVPMFLCNFLSSLYLLLKNGTASLYRLPGTGHYWGLAVLMGLLWMGGTAAYGAGALVFGKLGTSMGWIMFKASMIMTANILGLLTREWEGSSRRTMTIMATGVLILMLAIVVVGVGGISA